MISSQLYGAVFAITGVQACTDVAVLGIGRREAALARCLPYLVSGAAGVLLATACLDLLPEAVQAGGSSQLVWATLLSTLLVLFCVQVVVQQLTEGTADEGEVTGETAVLQPDSADHLHSHAMVSGHSRPAILMLGSALHSAVDGVAIAAAFVAGPRPGWSAALAVLLHELPHRMGDFAVLLHLGMERRRAAQFAIGAGAMALPGGLAVLLLGDHGAGSTYLLPVSAGSFLYIALVDLIPELHAHRHGRSLAGQTLCLLAGAALVALVVHLPGA